MSESELRSTVEPDLTSLFKAYDVRGIVPEELNERVVQAIGAAFAQLVIAEGSSTVVVAHDMRANSPSLSRAFAEGAASQGVDVIEAGLCSTDMLYFASGHLGIPGAMLTASHNPAQYNGIKLCRAGAAPVGRDSGLGSVRQTAQELLKSGLAENGRLGEITQADFRAQYATYLRSLVDLASIRRLRVVVDAGNGMGGLTVPVVLGDELLSELSLEIIPLYFELDGTFPNHEADPMNPKNLRDLQASVRKHGADAGLAFDGDADRCFVIDEVGEPVTPSTVTAMVAVRELAKNPGSPIIYNCITSRAVPEIVAEHGGVPIRTRVGHSFIKAEMARTDAVFGGEHSAHYYFRDFWRADTGMLVAMHVLSLLGESDRSLSALAKEYERYVGSGEINLRVESPLVTIENIKSWAASERYEIDELDGLTIIAKTWWANLRPSNTEPVLRLNVEADSRDQLVIARDRLLALVGPLGAD